MLTCVLSWDYGKLSAHTGFRWPDMKHAGLFGRKGAFRVGALLCAGVTLHSGTR